jgi:protease-4
LDLCLFTMSSAPTSPSPPPVPPRGRLRRLLVPAALIFLFISLLFNIGFVVVYYRAIADLSTEPSALQERFLLGDEEAQDKIAIVKVSGVISESAIQYPIHQLEKAAKDRKVKAVVLRVDSPGGTVFASEELYQNILNLRDNNDRRFKGTGAKPVHVSMGSLAASGGYYISAAGKSISAETTTITGSIGVFVALPNAAKWTEEHGLKLELVKAGNIKASGSFFHKLEPEERQTWQDTVDHAYDTFLNVITANRPALTTAALREKVVIDRMCDKRDEKGNPVLEPKGTAVQFRYTRTLADGGTFTAVEAKQFGLIDRVEDLPATIRTVASMVAMQSFKAVVYDRPTPLLERLTGLQIQHQQPFPNFVEISSGLTPRLWYLSPIADGGILLPNP